MRHVQRACLCIRHFIVRQCSSQVSQQKYAFRVNILTTFYGEILHKCIYINVSKILVLGVNSQLQCNGQDFIPLPLNRQPDTRQKTTAALLHLAYLIGLYYNVPLATKEFQTATKWNQTRIFKSEHISCTRCHGAFEAVM